MLAQAEHGAGSLVAAVSPSEVVCDALADTLIKLVVERPTVGEAAFALVAGRRCARRDRVRQRVRPRAPRADRRRDRGARAGQVRCAGCLFVGVDSATAFGDYVAGSNHVLPTGGAARFASTLSPRHFRRTMSEVHIGPAAATLAAAGAPIARAEGFDVHAESMEARVRENPQQ